MIVMIMIMLTIMVMIMITIPVIILKIYRTSVHIKSILFLVDVKKLGSSVGIVAKLLAGRSKNCLSTAVADDSYFSRLQR